MGLPSSITYQERHDALKEFLRGINRSLGQHSGCPATRSEIGQNFQETVLPGWLTEILTNGKRRGKRHSWVAALVCCSPFDLPCMMLTANCMDGLRMRRKRRVMSQYLGHFLQPTAHRVFLSGKYPSDFSRHAPAQELPAWHLVGRTGSARRIGTDGEEPRDGYPILLADWIRRDGLKCLKIKLRGNDAGWDYERWLRWVKSDGKWSELAFGGILIAWSAKSDYVNVIFGSGAR